MLALHGRRLPRTIDTRAGEQARIIRGRVPPGNNRYGFQQARCVIEPIDAVSAVSKRPRPVLIWSWPELAPYTNQALEIFAANPQAQTLIHFGEADDGCTGSPEFHHLLNTRFDLTASYPIPQFPNRHDRSVRFDLRPHTPC